MEYEFEDMEPWLESQREKEKKNISDGLNYWILINGKLKRASLMDWALFFESKDRLIDQTNVGDVFVSTVFLGIDHNFNFDQYLEHKPILFETMVFGGELDQFQWRYSTYGEAKQGHRDVLEGVRNKTQPEMSTGAAGFWMWFKDMFDDEEENEDE